MSFWTRLFRRDPRPRDDGESDEDRARRQERDVQLEAEYLARVRYIEDHYIVRRRGEDDDYTEYQRDKDDAHMDRRRNEEDDYNADRRKPKGAS